MLVVWPPSLSLRLLGVHIACQGRAHARSGHAGSRKLCESARGRVGRAHYGQAKQAGPLSTRLRAPVSTHWPKDLRNPFSFSFGLN
jgi:hypothetical protein